jgi:hypothetical protein
MGNVLKTVAFAVLLLPATPALAQDPPVACRPVSPTPRVVITMTDGGTMRGTLPCLTADEALLVQDGRTAATPLAAVTRIETRADPVWDGAVKGGVIPLALWAAFCHDCGDTGPLLRAVAAYAAIGLTWDSLQRNTKTIYVGRGSAAFTWSVRF